MRILVLSALLDELQGLRACWNYPSELKESLCTVRNNCKSSGHFHLWSQFVLQYKIIVANLHFFSPQWIRICCLKCHSDIKSGFMLPPCWGTWPLFKFWVCCQSLFMHHYWLYLRFTSRIEKVELKVKNKMCHRKLCKLQIQLVYIFHKTWKLTEFKMSEAFKKKI